MSKLKDIRNQKWIPNGGRVPGTIKGNQTIPVGTIIDRYGSQWGKYTSPAGVPYEQRAFPYIENPNAYHKYEVLKPTPGGDAVEKHLLNSGYYVNDREISVKSSNGTIRRYDIVVSKDGNIMVLKLRVEALNEQNNK